QEHSLLYFSKLDLQEQLTEAGQMLAQLESEFKQLDSDLQIQLEQSNYESLEQIQVLLELHARKAEMQALMLKLQQKLDDYPAQIEKINKQLDAERVHVSGAETLEGVVIQLRDKTVQMEIVAAELLTLEKKLAEQQQLLVDNTQLLQDIEQHNQIVQAAQAEILEIADEPENIFRRRVQMGVADKLLLATNRFLNKINGRYQISILHSDLGLAIEISDSKQENSKRALKSLSGGETFVVSLAMALGLSEIANNGRAIDSLFIDEGFGSLDAETLYTVVTTLENLKAQGKTVGIISHVEAIKQQIRTQVELVKQPNGMSRIILQKEVSGESVLETS
ncbi:MAG: chromosome segregation protein SMC, partial [Gammaproteobacteria bacterium]